MCHLYLCIGMSEWLLFNAKLAISQLYQGENNLHGAFGTGKTETIGQASMVLLKERPTAKILICAQSNR
jgi:superfamily I DNA and RNA helicase